MVRQENEKGRAVINIKETTTQSLEQFMKANGNLSFNQGIEILLEIQKSVKAKVVPAKRCDHCKKEVDVHKNNIRHAWIEKTDCPGKIKGSYKIEIPSDSEEIEKVKKEQKQEQDKDYKLSSYMQKLYDESQKYK